MAEPSGMIEHAPVQHGAWRELRAQFTLAWPTSLSMLFHYMIQPISLAFCGHLGKVQLASACMAISVIYVVTVSVGRGLAFGGDTFFAQTYGSTNKKNVGVYLQKGLIFGALWSMPVIAVLLNTESILLLIGQEQEIAAHAQEYTQLFCPGVLAYCWLFMLMRYLLCQNRVIPNLVICMISCAVNAVLNYGLVYQADMGIKGSAIALMMTYYLVLIQLVSYIWGSGLYHETWDGWSWRCLDAWGDFCRVTSFSISMTLVLWVCTEVGTFLGGLLSPTQLSAFSISFQIEGFAWMIPLGLGSACTTRIGQSLGANEPLGARTAARVSLTAAVLISVGLAGGTYLCRHLIPRIFTDNQELVEFTAGILRVTAIFLLLEGFGGVSVGIVRGAGRQGFGTVVMVVSYFVFAWPVGIPLMFATSLGLYGLWWGFVLGAAVQDGCFGLLVATLSWTQEARKAQVRAGVAEAEGDINTEEILEQILEPDAPGEPDEHTGLLGRTRSSINTAPPAQVLIIDARNKLIARRLLVCVVAVCILAVGIVTRLYVTVRPTWTSLCLPHNGTNVAYMSTHFMSLPNCTDTYSLPNCTDTYSLPNCTDTYSLLSITDHFQHLFVL